MIFRTKVRAGSVVFALLMSLTATLQAQTTGDIRGTITDSTGAVLPGVTVTITSDVLLGGSRTVATNELGVWTRTTG